MANYGNIKAQTIKLSPEDEKELRLRYRKAKRKVREHIGLGSNLPKTDTPVTMYYSVCQYVPNSRKPSERINIGLVFHIPKLQYSRIYMIDDYSKLKEKDSKFNSEFLDLFSESVQGIFNDGVDDLSRYTENIDKPSYLSRILKYYANTFRFTAIDSVVTETYVDKMVELEEKFL